MSYPPAFSGNGHPAGPPRRPGSNQPAERGTVPQPPAQPPLELLAAKFEELVASNQAKFAELAGRGVAPDPFYVLHARINHLIDQIAAATGPNGPRWGLMTRLGFEEVIAAELDQVGPQATLMQLAEGARYTPGMIAELARQTGTLRRTH